MYMYMCVCVHDYIGITKDLIMDVEYIDYKVQTALTIYRCEQIAYNSKLKRGLSSCFKYQCFSRNTITL